VNVRARLTLYQTRRGWQGFNVCGIYLMTSGRQHWQMILKLCDTDQNGGMVTRVWCLPVVLIWGDIIEHTAQLR